MREANKTIKILKEYIREGDSSMSKGPPMHMHRRLASQGDTTALKGISIKKHANTTAQSFFEHPGKGGPLKLDSLALPSTR